MIKLLKYMRIREWLMAVLLLSFLVAQIYCDVTLPTYTAEMVAKVQMGASATSIFNTGKIMLIYAAIAVIATVAETVLSAFISTGVSERLRGAVYGKALTLSPKETQKFTTASLLTRTTNDIQQVCTVMVLALRMGLGAPLMAILAVINIAKNSGTLTVATGVGVVVLIAGMLIISFVVLPKFALIQKLTDKLNGVSRENLTGIRVVRAYNAESYQTDKFDKVNSDLTKANIFTGRMTAALHPLISLVSYGVTLTIYWLGCYLIVSNNDAGLFPTMFATVQLASQVIMAFMIIVMLISWLPRAQISAKRINEVLACNSSIVDPEQSSEFTEHGTIEFKNVSFGYSDDGGQVLSEISFRAEQGQTVAVIGATGCGKTTLLSLIERFFDCTSGEVLVNGVNVKSIRHEDLQSVIGYVPQKSVLFAGSLADNIAFADGIVDAEKVEHAAVVACADEFINAMENGYDAAVAQGGKNFSGGQKQRVAIARAVYKDPQIFLFDDCFSALDYATDAKVRANLKEYAPSATKIIVAQRIGTILDADKIIVLEGGKAVGIGTHRELLKSCKTYRKIALSQLSAEELEL